MTVTLDAYAPFVGAATIEELRLLGDRLHGRAVQNINSTAVGGGVAEILSRLVPLLREVGVDARWDVIRGGEAFFAVTKKLHNALHGEPLSVTREDADVFRETTEENLRTLELSDDLVFVHDPQPLLVGGSATDDPEGSRVLAECRERAGSDSDIHVVELPPTANLEINALQRASTVVVQKSLREGFGLTVAEALWKGKPVIAGAVGGIPLQITHKYSGILTHTIEGTAYWIKQLLNAPDFARRLGENGREHVRWNFLLTRHLRDYLLLFLSLDRPGESLVQFPAAEGVPGAA